MTTTNKKETFVTPKGTARYPRVVKPDTKYKPEGEFSIELVLQADSKEAKALIKKIEAAEAEALAEAKAKAKTPAEAKKWEVNNRPFKMLEDEEGTETGEVSFKFTSKASGVSKKDGKTWNRTIPLFDAKGNKLSDVNVGGGSTVKVSYSVVGYGMSAKIGAGVKLQLEAVQVIELKEFTGGKDAKGFGFDEEEGYEAENDTFGDTADAADEDEDGEDF